MAASRPVAPGRIFISYRRAESGYPTSWLYDLLASHFGREDIIRDIDTIKPGDDFEEVIGHARVLRRNARRDRHSLDKYL